MCRKKIVTNIFIIYYIAELKEKGPQLNTQGEHSISSVICFLD